MYTPVYTLRQELVKKIDAVIDKYLSIICKYFAIKNVTSGLAR